MSKQSLVLLLLFSTRLTIANKLPFSVIIICRSEVLLAEWACCFFKSFVGILTLSLQKLWNRARNILMTAGTLLYIHQTDSDTKIDCNLLFRLKYHMSGVNTLNGNGIWLLRRHLYSLSVYILMKSWSCWFLSLFRFFKTGLNWHLVFWFLCLCCDSVTNDDWAALNGLNPIKMIMMR